MTSQVLYRKYRPKTFSEIVGQEHIVQTITNALNDNKISHAYLFCGPRGTGKTTFGRLLAKSLNCQNRKAGQFEPCNKCDSCLEINKGNAIDLIEIDAASNRGIDEIRSLKEGIGFVPVKSKYKVFIIDESHQLTKEASNALLKTLEEPPAHAVFVLATTEAYKMLTTIVSRCQRFDFRKLRLPEIIGRLEKILKLEKMAFDKEAVELIAFSANGSIRDAETLLDQVISFCGFDKKIEKEEVEQLLGLADRKMLLKFIGFLAEKKAKEGIEFLNEIIFKGIDPQELAKSLIQYLRQILFLKIDPDNKNPFVAGITEEENKELKDLGTKFSEKGVKEIIDEFVLAEQKIKYASIPQLPIELAIVEICEKKE